MVETKGTIEMTPDQIAFIIERLLQNAVDAVNETEENPGDDFYSGRRFAYYEMLDTLKNQLLVDDQNLSEYGLNINLEQSFL